MIGSTSRSTRACMKLLLVGALNMGCQDRALKSSVPIYKAQQVQLSAVRPGYYKDSLNGPYTGNLYGVSDVRSGGESIGYTFTPGSGFGASRLMIDRDHNVLGIVMLDPGFQGKVIEPCFTLSGMDCEFKADPDELSDGKYLPVFDQLYIRVIPPKLEAIKDKEVSTEHDCDHAVGAPCYPSTPYRWEYKLNDLNYIATFAHGKLVGFIKQ